MTLKFIFILNYKKNKYKCKRKIPSTNQSMFDLFLVDMQKLSEIVPNISLLFHADDVVMWY